MLLIIVPAPNLINIKPLLVPFLIIYKNWVSHWTPQRPATMWWYNSHTNDLTVHINSKREFWSEGHLLFSYPYFLLALHSLFSSLLCRSSSKIHQTNCFPIQRQNGIFWTTSTVLHARPFSSKPTATYIVEARENLIATPRIVQCFNICHALTFIIDTFMLNLTTHQH